MNTSHLTRLRTLHHGALAVASVTIVAASAAFASPPASYTERLNQTSSDGDTLDFTRPMTVRVNAGTKKVVSFTNAKARLMLSAHQDLGMSEGTYSRFKTEIITKPGRDVRPQNVFRRTLPYSSVQRTTLEFIPSHTDKLALGNTCFDAKAGTTVKTLLR
jgi:hypothetical protein